MLTICSELSLATRFKLGVDFQKRIQQLHHQDGVRTNILQTQLLGSLVGWRVGNDGGAAVQCDVLASITSAARARSIDMTSHSKNSMESSISNFPWIFRFRLDESVVRSISGIRGVNSMELRSEFELSGFRLSASSARALNFGCRF
jgi:hypothetical protein